MNINATETAEEAEKSRQALIELQTLMSTRFSSVEANLAAENTEAALSEAKFVLDTVRIKTGIDPKVKIQHSFLVPVTFPNQANTMSDLSEADQRVVIRTISDFRGGLYMDIMNLSKRTTLLYIRALKAEIQKHGGLTTEDREKIIRDVLVASLVPMPVEDKNGKKIVVLDKDIANEDHTYLFNRELKMYILQDADLKISEKEFRELFNQYLSKLIGRKEIINKDEPDMPYEKATICINQARSIPDPHDRNAAIKTCFYSSVNSILEFKRCHTLASSVPNYDDRNAAIKTCFKRFNK